MTAAEERRLTLTGVRNAAKALRSVDSALEKLERRLKRMKDRKKRLYGDDWNPVITDYNNMKNLIQPFEKALTDAINISNMA